MNHLINGAVNATWGRLSTAGKVIVLLAASIIVGLLLWQFGARAKNGVESWWFNLGVNQEQKELQESKALASDLLKQLQVEKEVTALERGKRELAEKILADKTLDANEKIKAYEEALQKPLPASPVGTTSDLCERAKRLGISCDAGN